VNKEQRQDLILILAAGLPFLFFGLGSISLLDPDEGMYGAIAREMAQGGDWITPHFNGVRYLEKPPLYFWLTALTMTFLGPSELAVRLWSALPGLGTAILIWRLGCRLYSGRSGVLSAVIFLTSIGIFRYTRVAATDSLLIFSLTLAIYGFVKTTIHRTPSRYPWEGQLLFYAGLALGFLSKGLIGIGFPLLIIGLFTILNRMWPSPNGGETDTKSTGCSLFTRRYSIIGPLLFLAVALPWHLLAAWKNPGFFQFYVLDNQWFRFLGSRSFVEDDVPVGTLTFLFVTYLWFFPWSMFLLSAWRQGFPNLRRIDSLKQRLRLLVGIWALTIIVFFSLSSSKLEHYSLPAIPALSLMVGALWSDAFNAAVLSSLRWSLAAAAAGCFVVGVALIMMSWSLTPGAVFTWLAEVNVYYRILKEQGAPFPFISMTPFVPLVRGLGMALVVGLPLSLLLFVLGRPRLSFIAVLGVAAAIAALVFKLILIIEPHHSAKSAALALNAQARPEELIVHEGSLEYSGSLPFYTGRQIRVLNGKRGDLDFGSRHPEGQGLFLDDNEFSRLWEGERRVFLVTPLPKNKSIVDRLWEDNIHFLGQYGSRVLYSNHEP